MRWVIFLLILIFGTGHDSPLVFFFISLAENCHRAIPSYMEFSLKQATLVAKDNLRIVFISNFKECARATNNFNATSIVQNISNIYVVDTEDIESNRTITFIRNCRLFFQSYPSTTNVGHYSGGLWVSSTARFFYVEDFMTRSNISNALHLEGDNMLYGSWHNEIIPILRSNYKGLATTRVNKFSVTASVFWISKLSALTQFTDFLMSVVSKGEEWTLLGDFVKQFRILFHHRTGNIRPAGITEMTMLAFFASKENTSLEMLPTIPKTVPNPFGTAIWDPGSWGQHIGGTLKKGKEGAPGFIDMTHFVGHIIARGNCTIKMLCDAFTKPNVSERLHCSTAPFVRCGVWNKASGNLPPQDGSYIWRPLYNLHVHSKKTSKFLSVPCPCNTTDPGYIPS